MPPKKNKKSADQNLAETWRRGGAIIADSVYEKIDLSKILQPKEDRGLDGVLKRVRSVNV